MNVTDCYYNTDFSIKGDFGVGMTTAELAATTVSDVFEGNEWTAGAIVNADKNLVTYKLPYLKIFSEKFQPTYTGYGPVVIAENGAYAGINGASDKTLSIPSGVGVNGPVLFKRSFSGDGFSTIMLPFTPNIAAETDAVAGVNFYKFKEYKDATISVSSVKQWDKTGTELKANTPYLIQVGNGSTSGFIFKNGGTFNTGNETVYSVSLDSDWEIYGTYEYKEWPTTNGITYGFAGQNGNTPSSVGKFKQVGNGAYIYPMRLYLEHTSSGSGLRAAPGRTPQATLASLPEDINVVIVDGENAEKTTAIGTISARTGEFKASGDRYFDLKGRNMGKKPAAKGSFYSKKKVAK